MYYSQGVSQNPYNAYISGKQVNLPTRALHDALLPEHGLEGAMPADFETWERRRHLIDARFQHLLWADAFSPASLQLIANLITLGADPNMHHPESLEIRALNRAIELGDLQLVRLLLNYGANVNFIDINGVTPLHWAARFDRSGEITDLLLNKGANPFVRDREGLTPYDYAVNSVNLLSIAKLRPARVALLKLGKKAKGLGYLPRKKHPEA